MRRKKPKMANNHCRDPILIPEGDAEYAHLHQRFAGGCFAFDSS